ncbi:MAG: hypothetical protein WCJ64_05565 [Rhodospirillaceae bacterium]
MQEFLHKKDFLGVEVGLFALRLELGPLAWLVTQFNVGQGKVILVEEVGDIGGSWRLLLGIAILDGLRPIGNSPATTPSGLLGHRMS